MIPPVFLGSSPGERLLFERFQADPGASGWIVLHSFEIAQHVSQIQGEIDFVVIVPGLGVLCLEVKGHGRVTRLNDGMWRLGGDPPTARSPFKQAADGMYSLRRFLRGIGLDLTQVPICSAVWFTHASVPLRPISLEWHAWQLLDRRDLGRPISEIIGNILGKARDHLASSVPGFKRSLNQPTAQQSREIAAKIRPLIEFALTPSDIRDTRDQERDAFVEDQYEALDVIEDEPRVLFTGAAGTGKTFLALEAASRASLLGHTVRMVCFNRLLGGWLAGKLADRKGVTAGSLHQAMSQITGTQPPAGAPSAWWQETLPELALDVLLGDQNPAADLLIVDEIQDLASPVYLDVIDLLVKGGLAAGRWLMFGDFERQAIYGGRGNQRHLAERTPYSYPFRLYRNCRNTPRIGYLAAQTAGLGNVYRGFRRPDTNIDPRFLWYETPAEQARHLVSALDQLRSEHYTPADIVVLSPLADAPAATIGPQALRRRLAPYGKEEARIGFTTVHSFKGLDAPAVVVTDINHAAGEAAEALLYVALSRATDQLIVLAHRDVQQEFAGNIGKGYTQHA